MPKKSSATRGGAQRHKPKAQRSVELVRQTQAAQKAELESKEEVASGGVTTSTIDLPAEKEVETSTPAVTTATASASNAPKGSASARLAARRQASQRAQLRSSATLITPEHYSYVRKDLVFIAILAVFMFAALIILHFIPAIGG